MTRRLLKFFSIAMLALVVASCAKKDHFVVTLEMPESGVQAFEMVYNAGGGVERGVASTDAKGVAKFHGVAPEAAVVELRRSNGELIATFPAVNGDKVTVKEAGGHVSLSGTKSVETLSELLAKAPQGRLSNREIAAFVGENRNNLLSTFLMVTAFNAQGHEPEADSLMNLIATEARPASLIGGYGAMLTRVNSAQARERLMPISVWGSKDSLASFVATAKPYGLLAFTGLNKPDSVKRLLKGLRADHKPARLQVMEVTMWGDSAAWRKAIARDSASWTQGWSPAAAASPVIKRLAVARTPFFIVTDSTGTQLYRGSSVTAARSILEKRLK